MSVAQALKNDLDKLVSIPSKKPCPKCGSNDILRKYRKTGDNHESEYLKEDWFEGTCKKECIANICRCCQFRWENDPLSKSAE